MKLILPLIIVLILSLGLIIPAVTNQPLTQLAQNALPTNPFTRPHYLSPVPTPSPDPALQDTPIPASYAQIPGTNLQYDTTDVLAAEIVSLLIDGQLDHAYFDAYANLSANNRLDNDSGTDILTRSQADARYATLSSGSTSTGTVSSGLALQTNDLTDVDSSNPEDGQILKYDAGLGYFTLQGDANSDNDTLYTAGNGLSLSSSNAFSFGGTLTSDITLALNSQDFLLTGSGGLGVGLPSSTTSTTAYLDLAAATSSRPPLRIRTGTTPTSPNTGSIYSDGTNLYYYNGSTWDDLTATGGGSLFTQSGSDIYYNDGNVGIGTTAPSAKLEISGNTSGIKLSYDVSNAATINVLSDGSLNLTSQLSDSTSKIYQNNLLMLVSNDASKSLAFGVNANPAMNSSDWGNTSIGTGALESQTISYFNTVVGAYAANKIDTGNWVTAIGYGSLQNNTTGVNTAVGAQAARAMTTGSYNTIIGRLALRNNLTGTLNTIVGESAGYNNLGSGNIFLGNQAGYNETGSNKLYIDNSNTTSPLIWGDFDSNLLTINGNLGIGTTAPGAKLDILAGNLDLDNTTNNNQYGIITKDGTPFIHNFNYGNNGTVTTSGGNVFVGDNSGNLTMGSTATSVGEASYNTALGTYTLNANTTGGRNVAVGTSALRVNTTGSYNNMIGYGAGRNNTTGSWNTAMGNQAFLSNISGGQNTAIGYEALYANTSGYRNTGIGYWALKNITTTTNNTALGYYAGTYLADGSSLNQTASNSLYLGMFTRASAAGNTNEIVIGANAIGNGSNTVTLGDDNITKTILKGNVGIGTTNPDALLELNDPVVADLHLDAQTSVIYIDKYDGAKNADIRFQTNGVTDWYVGSTDSDSAGDGNEFYIGETVGGLSPAIFIETGGNVGIGTTAPTLALLQVGSVGTGSFTVPGIAANSDQIGIGASATASGAIAIGSNSSATHINCVSIGINSTCTGGNQNVALGASASATGWRAASLGYNSTAAQEAVAIGGGANAYTYSVAIGTDATTTTWRQFVSGSENSRISDVYFGKGVVSTTPVAYSINGTGGSGTDIAGGDLQLAGGKGTGNASGGSILFQTSDAGASSTTLRSLTTKMILDPAGNLGIGTTAPGYNLDVVGKIRFQNDGDAGGVVLRENPSGSSLEIRSVSDNSYYAALGEYFGANDGSTSVPGFVFMNDYNTGIRRISADTLSLVTGGSDRLTINSSGYVGISTTSPGVKLSLGGVGAANSAASKIAVWDNGSTSFTGTGLAYNNTLWGLGLYANKGYTDDPQVFLTSAGNVGIGTTAPSNGLSVAINGNNSSTNLNGGNSNTIPALTFQSGIDTWANTINGFGVYYSSTDGDLDLYRKTGTITEYPVLTLKRSNGNVGIGTTSPNSKLEVGTGQLSVPYGTDGAPGFAFNGDLDTGIYNLADNEIAITAGGVRQFTVDSVGGIRISKGISVGTSNNSPADGQIRIAGSNPSIYFDRNGTTDWILYPASGSTLYLRDATNARMHTYYVTGATASTAETRFDSKLMVGSSGAAQNTLHVAGTIRVDTLNSASDIDLCTDTNGVLSDCSSSLRYKDNISDLDMGLDTILAMRPVEFDWQESGLHSFGFVAEEMQAIDDRLVTYKDGQIEGVKYKQLTAVLTNAVQELSAEVESLKLTTSLVPLLTKEGIGEVTLDNTNNVTPSNSPFSGGGLGSGNSDGIPDQVRDYGDIEGIPESLGIASSPTPRNDGDSAVLGTTTDQILKQSIQQVQESVQDDTPLRKQLITLITDTIRQFFISSQDLLIATVTRFTNTVTFDGLVRFNQLDPDQVGQLVIPAGQTEQVVQFDQPFGQAPIVVLTPLGDIAAFLQSSSTTQFTVRLRQAYDVEVMVNWHAFPGHGSGGFTAPDLNQPSPVILTPTDVPTGENDQLVSDQLTVTPTLQLTATPTTLPTIVPEPTTELTLSPTPTTLESSTTSDELSE